MDNNKTLKIIHELVNHNLKNYFWFEIKNALYRERFDAIVLKMNDRDYVEIIDGILADIPINDQIDFCERFKEDIPDLSIKYDGENRIEWGHILRIGELMIEQAVILKVWSSTASTDLIGCATKEISHSEIKYLSDKYNEQIPVYEIMNSIINKNPSLIK
ncbi:hypothetical protein [Klebsiella pneumoniae]|uniref:hypothetical protein n=1 Tax=Klebsiella pneumoniae TaxID=573 RepID=UPI0009BC0A41|nr:hypothetical protein [Klebsiella pneumoniae]SLX31757.1 Uncharacterised protein [Klebsiella pneumoniae]SLY99487.1 Uncharacterised protein [Klebsiella pneumoniae]